MLYLGEAGWGHVAAGVGFSGWEKVESTEIVEIQSSIWHKLLYTV
jgi:hypothetical protein